MSLWIAECEQAKLIEIYEVSGTRYLQIDRFGQRIRKEQESKFPELRGNPRESAGNFGDPREISAFARATTPPPTTTTHTTPNEIFDLEKILDNLESLYLAAGKPVPPKHRQMAAQMFISIPPEKWSLVAVHVNYRLEHDWRDPTKTKSLLNLLRDGDWDVPLVERTLPPPRNGTGKRDIALEMLEEERARRG
jgi:hypothetical protein